MLRNSPVVALQGNASKRKVGFVTVNAPVVCGRRVCCYIQVINVIHQSLFKMF